MLARVHAHIHTCLHTDIQTKARVSRYTGFDTDSHFLHTCNSGSESHSLANQFVSLLLASRSHNQQSQPIVRSFDGRFVGWLVA